ncbi:MAG TPA: protease pro-enzyme activation domain-containing protein, partial [Terriglobales bacterium]|nr:protease pro-enzyme activation domain-containing protein [Terriglobales bacterium]
MAVLFAVGAQSQSALSSKVSRPASERISHSTHPLATPRYDVGGIDPQTWFSRMVLVLGPTEDKERELRAYLGSQQDKNSPNYRRWMTPAEFGDRFGPSPNQVGQVISWLRSQGFQVGAVARSRRWIEFSGTSRQVEATFQTRMRQYQVGRQLHIANATDISLPTTLTPVIRGVLSLHDFFSHPLVGEHYAVERNSWGQLVPAQPAFTLTGSNGTFHYVAPGDLGKIYNFSPLQKAGLDGSGQTIAIV